MAPNRTRRNKAARERLGALLIRRRVELDPRYSNRALFAREKGINYRMVQDVETAADTRANLEPATKALIEVVYRWAPGAVDAVLAGRDPALPRLEYDDPDLQRVWEASEGAPEAKRREIIELTRQMRDAHLRDDNRDNNGAERSA